MIAAMNIYILLLIIITYYYYYYYYRATLCVSAVLAVGRCFSVCLSHSSILCKRLQISSNFFLDLVGPSPSFLRPSGIVQFQGESSQWGALHISTESAMPPTQGFFWTTLPTPIRFLPARRIVSAVYATATWLSGWRSVTAGIVSERLNLS